MATYRLLTEKWMTLEHHPVALVFPKASDEDFNALKESIENNGFDEVSPITLYEGLVLDGRNRLDACKELEKAGRMNTQPIFQSYNEEWGSPADWTLSRNLARRHLSESQKAAIAVDIKPLFEEEARKRQQAGKKVEEEPDAAPTVRKGRSRKKAADAVGVSERLVQDAQTVKQKDPEAFEDVKAGKVTVSKARKKIQETEPPKPATKRGKKLPELTPPAATDFVMISRDIDTAAERIVTFYSGPEIVALVMNITQRMNSGNGITETPEVEAELPQG